MKTIVLMANNNQRAFQLTIICYILYCLNEFQIMIRIYVNFVFKYLNSKYLNSLSSLHSFEISN